MEDCENCTKCLDHIDGGCVKYTGDSYPELGINNGDTIIQVVDKLAEKVKELSNEEKDCDKC